MTREPAQAGNRAGRTEHHLQWWDDSPERLAVTSVADKQRNFSLFCILLTLDRRKNRQQTPLKLQCLLHSSAATLQAPYLLGILAMIKCSICSYQCDN